jgi:hypothetical protein
MKPSTEMSLTTYMPLTQAVGMCTTTGCSQLLALTVCVTGSTSGAGWSTPTSGGEPYINRPPVPPYQPSR